MKTIIPIVFACFLSPLAKLQAQCNQLETITFCDMTTIDHDSDGTPDGIINLYDEYNALTGSSISLATGTWFDPGYNFALDDTTGDLYLWDLAESSTAITDYQVQLIDPNSSCTDGILISLNVVIGPFSGFARPVLNIDDVNLEVCDVGSTPTDACVLLPDVNLFETLESIPSPHLNGQWIYNGSSPNFISLSGSELRVTIPYTPGPPLVEQETFELTYRVSGIPPCNSVMETTVNVSVTRQVFSGYAINHRICELDLINGLYDADIDISDDNYLLLEDVEGVWLTDSYGQISSETDSFVNLKAVYDQMIINNPRFGCSEIWFNYSVEQRSGVCGDAVSTVKFKIYEYLRPFNQRSTIPEFCEDDPLGPTINLYDELEFTTENGVLFDYRSHDYTDWAFISGPSNLGLLSNTDPNYSYMGSVSLANAAPGTYVFEYRVGPNINCQSDMFEVLDYNAGICMPPKDLSGFCNGQSTQVILIVHPKLYAGDDTTGLSYCENDPIFDAPLDLFSLLNTNGIDNPIYQGAMGEWTETITGNVVSNMFTLPSINDQQQFDFTYTTTTAEGCIDTANLSFLVYEEYQAGMGGTLDVCTTSAAFNLFDSLTGSPNTTGTWSGPNGYTTTDHNATFDPASASAGTYTYTVPNNVLCMGNQVSIIVNLHQSPNAGNDMSGAVCRSDAQIDLFNYIDPSADSGGTFTDLDATNALSGSFLNVSQLSAGTYHFQYEIQGHASCSLAASVISITVEEVSPATTSNQSFCASDGPTVADLQASGALGYNWYEDATAIDPLPLATALVDGEDYYVTAVDANGCESPRTFMVVTIFPLGYENCDNCLKDGISPNGDNLNDVFDLCNLPVTYPNFELNIFNRYGTLVFKGNQNTELFEGISNVSLTIGKALPSGIYFYVFEPKDGATDAFQGNFYLSR